MQHRSGFTLIELLIVIVIIGAISMFAFPRLQAAYRGSALRGGRAAAVQTNLPVRVHFAGNAMWVTATPRLATSGSGTADTIGPVQSLYDVFGVTITTGVDSLLLDPRGLGLNGGTIVLAPSSVDIG